MDLDELAARVGDVARLTGRPRARWGPGCDRALACDGNPRRLVRKKAKDYGTQRLAEGAEVDGRQVVIVEDVVTTGGQILPSTADLRERGAVVTTAVCVLDRDQGGAEALAEIGVELRSLFVRGDVEH